MAVTATLKFEISVMDDHAPANGFSENCVLVRVVDEGDTPHAGWPIAFSVESGAVLLDRDAVTNHFGIAHVGVVSDKEGSYRVTAFVDGDGGNRSIAVTFTKRRSGLALALRGTDAGPSVTSNSPMPKMVPCKRFFRDTDRG